MKRIIKKTAVLGSGIMGSRIACHFANIGLEVLLLDIVPKDLSPGEKEKGLDQNSQEFRNRIVNESLQAAIKSNPSPLYHKKFANRIKTGNFEDDLMKISSCDWIIEAVIEDLGIKMLYDLPIFDICIYSIDYLKEGFQFFRGYLVFDYGIECFDFLLGNFSFLFTQFGQIYLYHSSVNVILFPDNKFFGFHGFQYPR